MDTLFTTEQGVTWSMDWRGDGECVIAASQDCSAIFDENQAIANDYDPRTKKDETFRLVRRVPIVLIEAFKNDLGVDFYDPDAAKRVVGLLNDSDYAKTRVWDGTI